MALTGRNDLQALLRHVYRPSEEEIRAAVARMESLRKNTPPPRRSRRQRLRIWLRVRWNRVWDLVHRILPGECSHEDCY